MSFAEFFMLCWAFISPILLKNDKTKNKVESDEYLRSCLRKKLQDLQQNDNNGN